MRAFCAHMADARASTDAHPHARDRAGSMNEMRGARRERLALDLVWRGLRASRRKNGLRARQPAKPVRPHRSFPGRPQIGSATPCDPRLTPRTRRQRPLVSRGDSECAIAREGGDRFANSERRRINRFASTVPRMQDHDVIGHDCVDDEIGMLRERHYSDHRLSMPADDGVCGRALRHRMGTGHGDRRADPAIFVLSRAHHRDVTPTCGLIQREPTRRQRPSWDEWEGVCGGKWRVGINFRASMDRSALAHHDARARSRPRRRAPNRRPDKDSA